MTPDRNKMTPDELRDERLYQEKHFRYLVSQIDPPLSVPKTWYGRWWRKWCHVVDMTIRICVGSVLYLAIASAVVAFITLLVTAL